MSYGAHRWKEPGSRVIKEPLNTWELLTLDIFHMGAINFNVV